MSAQDDDRILELVVGDETPVDLEVRDDRDQAEDLTAATRARWVVKESVSDPIGSAKLDLSTGGSGLVFQDRPGGVIRATLSAGQAAALTPGRYVATLAIEFPGPIWRRTDRFYVDVAAQVTPNL